MFNLGVPKLTRRDVVQMVLKTFLGLFVADGRLPLKVGGQASDHKGTPIPRVACSVVVRNSWAFGDLRHIAAGPMRRYLPPDDTVLQFVSLTHP